MSIIECPRCRWQILPGLSHVCTSVAPPTYVTGQAPPIPGSGPGGAAPALRPMPSSAELKAQRLLNANILSVYKERVIQPSGQAATRLVDLFNPEYKTVLTNAPAPVNSKVVDALLTAIANSKTGNSPSQALVYNAQGNVNVAALALSPLDSLLSLKIRDFKAMSQPQQYEFIDNIYNMVTEVKVPNKILDDMYDPISTSGKLPVPTSFCPTAPGQNTFAKRLDANATAFKTYGVGFRIDGELAKNDLERIKRNGLTTWSSTPATLKAIKGWEIEGTVLAEYSKVRLWKKNHDIFNESAVCLSRNLFGGCAFPFRESVGNNYLLWAASVRGLLGFDTEGYQLNKPNSRQWRPGEKAYLEVPPAKLIGYVLVHRRGVPSHEGGWKFYIPPDAQWTIISPPGTEVLNYINDELKAWKGYEYSIGPEYDFAT